MTTFTKYTNDRIKYWLSETLFETIKSEKMRTEYIIELKSGKTKTIKGFGLVNALAVARIKLSEIKNWQPCE